MTFDSSLLLSVYQGEWVNGKAHGQGKETRPDGSIRHDGLWENDKPIRDNNKIDKDAKKTPTTAELLEETKPDATAAADNVDAKSGGAASKEETTLQGDGTTEDMET